MKTSKLTRVNSAARDLINYIKILWVCSFSWWLVAGAERKVMLAGGWFVLREKYCWVVADKPNEQAVC
jgi:hypothetical protein